MTHRSLRRLAGCVLVCGMLVAFGGAGLAQDADGDGMSDELEKALATDPGFAETLEVIAEGQTYEATAERPARYDIARVRFGNVAQGRWVWAIEFAEAYSFENALLILYVDSDNDPETGRPGMGCETTYGQRNGLPSQMFYLGDERRADFPPPRVGLQDGVLYICADLALKQEGGRSKFRMMVLSEQSDPHETRDALGYTSVEGPGDSEREKTITLADLAENEGFEVTENAEQLWRIHADKRNVILNSFQDCEFEGFVYNHSEYRWPSVRRSTGEGTLRVAAPKAGRFWLGAVVYDGRGAEGYEMSVDGEIVGRFVARADNKRQRVFFAEKPIEFRGGESILLRAASTGARYIVEDIVLLAERPEVLKPAREIRGLEVGYDWAREEMRATWITTWPVACQVVCGDASFVEEAATQNHRVYLPGLQAGVEYACSIEASDAEGAEVAGPTVRFVAGPPEIPKGSVARDVIPLSVRGGDEPFRGWDFTTAIPFARGVLGSADHLRLVDLDGYELPFHTLQARTLVRWPDGSVKVALIDASLPYTEPPTNQCKLEYGYEVRERDARHPITVHEDDASITVTTRNLKAQFDKTRSGLFTRLWMDRDGEFPDDMLITRDDAPATISIIDDAGNVYDTLGAPDDIIVEEAGPLRTVIRADGHHTGPEGEFFTYQIRFAFGAGGDGLQLSYRWGNDVSSDEFAKFRGIRLEWPVALDGDAEFMIGADDPVRGKLAGGGRVEQLYDDKYTAGEATGERAPGWVQASDGSRLAVILCRQFWQLYPKAIGAENGALYLDICPEFAEDQYNDCSELDLIKWYYYLQDGRYKVRQGMTKVHDILLGFDSATGLEAPEFMDQGSRVEWPILTASPDYYASTGVFGDFVPKTAGRTPRYDEVCDRVYDRCIRHRDGGREFGMLNYGDQWGERRVNWANGEYDHHHTAAQMFLRSAEPRWYHLMTDMARHDIDVDLCHYHTNPYYRGASWIHSMGHTGRYFAEKYQGEFGMARGGTTVTHTWCEGTCEHYLLTGDPSAIEAVRMIADHYGGTYLNNYDFTNGRVPGWHLLLTMAVYRATYDPFYLNAARIIVDRTLERRTPGSGWARQMVPGHCHCEPRCRGCCSFMQGILGCGLREYFVETGDERIRLAVVEAARYDIEQLWVEEKEAFRYTSCPKSGVGTGRATSLAGILLFAHELSGDPEFLDVARRSMNLCFESLGGLSQQRWTPYIIHAFDRVNREAIGIGGEGGATMMLRNDKERSFEVRLSDRAGVGAPPDAAVLTAPDGTTQRPGEAGRIKVDDGVAGNYMLRIARGPWQVTSSLNPMVASLREGLALEVRPMPLYLMGRAGDAPLTVTIYVVEGKCGAILMSPSGGTVGTVHPTESMTTLTCQAAEEGLHTLILVGPGRVRFRVEGGSEWAAFSPGRYFNASAPNVTIEGGGASLPGEGRTIRLRAIVADPENDVAGIRWELPDGRAFGGEEVTFIPEGDATGVMVRVIATDAEGNVGTTSADIRLLPPAMADAKIAITLQAEDFSDQGGGEVMVVDRIGNVGKMITMWHASIGHWLEWEFEAPVEGEYALFARFATDSAESVRKLTIDGELPGAGFDDIRFARTGGFCTATDNWEIKQLGPAVRLGAGEHSLRMTNLAEGLAMDYLAVVSVE